MKKSLRITLYILAAIALIIAFMPQYLRVALIYQTPDIDDYRIFNNRKIIAENPQPWEYAEIYNQVQIPDEFEDSLMKYDPVAFLIVRDGKILFENYWDDFDPTSHSGSFSMAKSIVALLVGAAIDDGYITSVHQPVRDFIPDFAISDHDVNIYHLLTMTSGLDWDEEYAAAFSITTKAYYGNNLRELLMPLGLVTEPGAEFYYSSGTTQLLAFILEAATGKTVSEYASEKLWTPLGAEVDALWSTDRKEGIEKVYCCFNSNARDFARLGQLVLNNGLWNDQQLISSNFIQMATEPLDGVKDRKGNDANYYGYQFWILNHDDMQIPYFRGILGQYIFVIPQWNAVVVRLGHKRSEYRINDVPSDVFVYVDMAVEILREAYYLD